MVASRNRCGKYGLYKCHRIKFVALIGLVVWSIWYLFLNIVSEQEPCVIYHNQLVETVKHNDKSRDTRYEYNLNVSTFGRIFTNSTLYSQKIQKYIDIAVQIYPKSWQDLNNQLFCPIKYSSSLSLNKDSIVQESILKHIFSMQFLNNDRSECLNPNRKCK